MTTLTVDSPRREPRKRGLPWVTWRQHRLGLIGAVALLGGVSVLLIWSRISIHRSYSDLGLNHCTDYSTPQCRSAMDLFLQQYQGWGQFLPRFLTFVPVLLGVFVGAPVIAKELESGTFRFAWTQGRSRVQWTVIKIVLLGLALTAAALSFSALFAWWFTPFVPAMGRMESGQAYEVLGVVFAARTLFAFTLGVFLGAVIRRSIPAMAATGTAWLLVAWPSVLWLRPRIEKPISVPDNANLVTQNGWVVHSWIQDPGGHHLSELQLFRLAQSTGQNTRVSFEQFLTAHHYTRWVSYQPDSRFWHFQLIEASAYLALAILFGFAATWWVARRAT